MNNFVDIETVFDSLEDRNIDYLSKIYNEKTRMHSVIHRMINEHFCATDIEGKGVLLKPNWVMHELKESDYLCLRTNDNLLLCVLEEILTLSPSRVLLADAPVQGCKWDQMIKTSFVDEVKALSKKFNIPVFIKDFRRTISDVSNNKVVKNLHPMSDYVVFDLQHNSYLEPITTSDNRFRITCYNPDDLAAVHHKGTHKYCVAKDFFDFDVVITIPKIKTHRMAGLTNSLKLLIGINGDKDYLPHHRIGSLKEGGDNYKHKSVFRTIGNYCIDEANRNIGSHFGRVMAKIGNGFWLLSKPDKSTLMNAGWYGNDTIWRTVLDINKIALYGDRGGGINNNQQRQLVTIMDGIIGGQGDGPLHPDPSPLGILAISNNPYLMDVAASKLYHLDLSKIPLLREANRYIENDNNIIKVNSQEVKLEQLTAFGINIKMSPGWEDYNK